MVSGNSTWPGLCWWIWHLYVLSTALTRPDRKVTFHPGLLMQPSFNCLQELKMAVSLVKGGNVSLTKEAPTMNIAMVGLGWDARVTDGQAFEQPNASVFAVGEDGKVLSDAHFIFFNNKTSPDGAVEHQGDNRTGEGDGDDEQVKIDLTKVSAGYQKLVFARYHL